MVGWDQHEKCSRSTMDLRPYINKLLTTINCSFCRENLKDPVSARCQHSFCDVCISGAVKGSQPCPVCKKYSKSRSLKNSPRLRSLVPLVQKLINQLETIDPTQTDGKVSRDILAHELEKTLNGNERDHGDGTDIQKTDTQNKAANYKPPRLWGRLLSASASSSSSEDLNSPSMRGAILQNEPCQQSVEAKVACWLESSVPATLTENLNEDSPLEETIVSDDDIISASITTHQHDHPELNKPKSKEEQSLLLSNGKTESDISLQNSVFPKATVLKTFSSTNKLSILHRREILQFSQDSVTHASPVKANGAKSFVAKELPKQDENGSVAVCEPSARQAEGPELPASSISSPPKLQKICESNPEGNKTSIDNVTPNTGQPQSEKSFRCKRIEVFDTVQVKPCGYADIHAENSDPNIVLQHLEKAIAEIPQCKPLPMSNGVNKANDKEHDSRKRTDIVHKSQDLISAMAENLKTPKKRRIQTAKRTKPKKLARRDSNGPGFVSTVPKRSVSEGDGDQMQQLRSRKIYSERNCSSGVNSNTGRYSFFCSQPGSVPVNMTSVFVKMVRLDDNLIKRPTSTVQPVKKSPEIQVSTTPEKIEPISEGVNAECQNLNTELDKSSEWRENAADEEADDIICCSWNESEDVINRSTLDNPRVEENNNPMEDVPVADCMGATKDDQLHEIELPDAAVVSRIISSLHGVAALEKSFLLQHFANSMEKVCQAIDMCKQALASFKEEIASKNLDFEVSTNNEMYPAASSRKSAVDSSPVPSAVDDCIADFVKCNSSCNDEVLISESEKSHDAPVHPTEIKQSGSQSLLEAVPKSDVSEDVAMDARSEDMLESILPIQEKNKLVESQKKAEVINKAHASCDDAVAAKVESWLNRLTDLDETQGKKQKKLIGAKWRSSPHNTNGENMLKQPEEFITVDRSSTPDSKWRQTSDFNSQRNDHLGSPSAALKNSQGWQSPRKHAAQYSLSEKKNSQKSQSVANSHRSKSDTEQCPSEDVNRLQADSSSPNMFEESMDIDSQLAGIISNKSPESKNSNTKAHGPSQLAHTAFGASPDSYKKSSSKTPKRNQLHVAASVGSPTNKKNLTKERSGQNWPLEIASVNDRGVKNSAFKNFQQEKPKVVTSSSLQHSSFPKKKLGFITSGLQDSETKLVKVFAKRHGGTYHDVFNHENVTHVVMRATKKKSCDRTLKYLMGIASKKWIVTIEWVIESLHAGKKLAEENYEILGDNCMKEFDFDISEIPRGPTRSRTSDSQYKLLEYFLCVCVPPFCLITIEQTSELLRLCGATVASNFDELKLLLKNKNHFRNRLVIVDAEVAADFPNYAAIEKEFDAAVINIEWVYETISRYEAQPISNFALAAFTQDSSVHYS